MKKPPLTLAFIFLAGWVSAQVEFAPIGAIWHFDFYQFVAELGYEKITVEKDTVLFGKQAKKLKLERVAKIYPSNDLYFYEEVHFLHQTGDTIWHFDPNTSNQNDFNILFDFSLLPGDTLFYDGFGYHFFAVDSIGTIELNGESYLVQYGNTSTSFVNPPVEIISSSKTGPLNKYLFLDMPDYCAIDGPCRNFRCYDDEDFPLLQLSDEDCEFIVTSTAEARQKGILTISPNPAEEKVQIALPDLNSISSLQLYNSNGHLLLTLPTTNGATVQEIHLGGYPDGLYFIHGRSEKGILSTGKIVKGK